MDKIPLDKILTASELIDALRVVASGDLDAQIAEFRALRTELLESRAIAKTVADAVTLRTEAERMLQRARVARDAIEQEKQLAEVRAAELTKREVAVTLRERHVEEAPARHRAKLDEFERKLHERDAEITTREKAASG